MIPRDLHSHGQRRPRFLLTCALLLPIFAGLAVVEAFAAAPAVPTPAKAQISTLMVHITTPPALLSTAYTQAEDQVREEAKDRWLPLQNGQGSLRAPWWRQRLTWKMTASRLEVIEQLHFSLVHNASSNDARPTLTQCGTKPPKDAPGSLRLNHNATLSLSPQYTPRAVGTTVKIDLQARCALPTLAADPMPVVTTYLQSEREHITGLVTAGLERDWPIKERMATVWAMLQEPIVVDEASKTWLVLAPRATRAGPISLRDSQLAATIGVVIEPRVIRTVPPPTVRQALPPADSQAPSTGYHSTLEIPVPFQEADDRLREALVGQQFGQSLGTVTVLATRFTSAGDRARVDLDLDVAGLTTITLQLTGTPVLDEPSQTVSFTNLDYAITNRSALADLAESLLHEEFRRQLERKLRIELAPRLDVVRQRMNQELTRDWRGGKLQGQVKALRVRRLSMERTQFLVQFVGDGELHYTVAAKPETQTPTAPASR